MKVLKKQLSILMIFSTIVLSSCTTGHSIENPEQFISIITDIDIPDDVQVIGLGEATHGNAEFQTLKKDLFEVLVEQVHVNVFVLEGDFGGARNINSFILHGEGDVESAIASLDYDIYKTKEMIELVQWMRDYNQLANDEDKLYFYGNDMQRYDYSKHELLLFYDKVNESYRNELEEELSDATNANMFDLTEKQLNRLKETIEQIVADLISNEKNYVERSTIDEFIFAQQYAELLRQRTELLLNEQHYSNLRDQYLAENLQWIVQYEAARSHDKVFVSAHNGHIEKTSSTIGVNKVMGDYLDDMYGEKYVAIGTDFMKSRVRVLNRGANKRKTYTIKHRNELLTAFQDVEPNVFYVDFEKANEHQDLLDMISSYQAMGNIGDDFRFWYKFLSMFYTIKMVPNEAYDGLIIVKEATPTEEM